MKRSYTHIKILEPQIIKMRKGGKTKQEIADALGRTKMQVKNWVNCHNKQKNVVLPKKHCRPRKHPISTYRALELRMNELEREVDLYQSFLQACGRM